jgi:UDP-N-acetylglucosamine acyltransferase
MTGIHPTALVSPKAAIGRNVSVGAFSIIEEGVSIGDDTTVLSHAFIGRDTLIGKNNFIHMGCVIGHEAQHKQAKGIKSVVKIGDHNIFREYVTVHRASAEGASTLIGSHNYFMVNSHVGHDTRIHDHVTLTNGVLLGGHVEIQDHTILGGGSAVHQFCRIGAYSMIGGLSSITKDVPPYMLVDDQDDRVGSLNVIGLRRAGFSEEIKREIKNAYKLFYLSGLNSANAATAIRAKCRSKEALAIVQFMEGSKRGMLGHRRQHTVNP